MRVAISASSPLAAQMGVRLRTLAALPGVVDAAEAARESCTRLRFNEVLRRRAPEAGAESRVRGARASAALDGAQLPIDVVRDLVRGALSWPAAPDPVSEVVRGAVQATAETEHITSLLFTAPLQALARLHLAATAALLPADQVGRPRTGTETSGELVDLGPAPAAGELPVRLGQVAGLLAAAGDIVADVPALVVAGLVHAEIASARPFVRGNGVVARAMERAVIQACGLDPTGVAVPEAGHAMAGQAAYVGALAAYGTGRREGVALWLRHCGEAMVAAAAEGERICASIRTGRLA